MAKRCTSCSVFREADLKIVFQETFRCWCMQCM